MNFGQAIAICLRKYATFSGRASRSEYWWFMLFCTIVMWSVQLVGIATFAFDSGILAIAAGVLNLFFFIPTLSAGSRRLHDTGRSGWWQLLPLTIVGIIFLLIWLGQGSRMEGNKYGPPEPGARRLADTFD